MRAQIIAALATLASATTPSTWHASQGIDLLKDWSQLSGANQDYWKVLGWTEDSWRGDAPHPSSESLDWEGLSSDQKVAATELGFNPLSWDSAPDVEQGD